MGWPKRGVNISWDNLSREQWQQVLQTRLVPEMTAEDAYPTDHVQHGPPPPMIATPEQVSYWKSLYTAWMGTE